MYNKFAPRRELFNSNTIFIYGLRLTDPCMMLWMFTQYFLLDMNRNWEMASTTRRQVHCLIDKNNGAKYLESSLRNLASWESWNLCWRESFTIGFVNYLESLSLSQKWVEKIRWRSYEIDKFNLEWQDYKTTGLVDRMIITTAFGLSYPLELTSATSFSPTNYISNVLVFCW
ncbi:hypothetical protein THRCLA_03427 [Thraustotheca clavata]|uniref:Uncharacterized protein n=1 Tax=Thraustotheca clavata TaxID=74557 RepID=A0A1W0A212_9STRA|nr:hypothetical protein THRCLA_03427 [Thraustotheca clavata]